MNRILSTVVSTSKVVHKQPQIAVRQFSRVGSRQVIEECPEKVRFGLTGLSVLIVPFIYVGGMFSKKAASLLEDYDIFVPEDDDDD